MANSPFHVETGAYKYAIEHELDGYPVKGTPVICEWRRKQLCTLWNSGFQKCSAFKCKFLHHHLRNNYVCSQCAYGKKCVHADRKVPFGEQDVASYCCFFLNEKIDKDRYHIIKNEINQDITPRAINKLSNIIKKKESVIQNLRSWISQAERKITSNICDDGEQQHLAQKIIQCKEQIAFEKKQIYILQKQIEGLSRKYNDLHIKKHIKRRTSP